MGKYKNVQKETPKQLKRRIEIDLYKSGKGTCSNCHKDGFPTLVGFVIHPELNTMCKGYILGEAPKSQPYEKELKRMQEIAWLWVKGTAAIMIGGTLICCAIFIFALLREIWLVAFLLFGIITIPILIALFILPRLGFEV